MAIRPDIPERSPIDNAEVEYERSSAPRRDRRPGFNRARLLDVSPDHMEIASREVFHDGEKVQLTLHIRTVRDYLVVSGNVINSTRITLLRQAAFAIDIGFQNLSESELKKLAWAQEQLAPRRTRTGPLRRTVEPTPEKGGTPETTPAVRATTDVAFAAGAEESGTAKVKRPVALLELIDRLEGFEITDDLILAVIEAAEAGTDVEALYPVAKKEDAAATAEEAVEAELEATLPEDGQVRPMNVYRLAQNTRLHFSEQGLPVGPPKGLFYISRLSAPETCFAVELELDTMAHAGWPNFPPDSILLFRKASRVESGDFAFVKLRTGDEFVQVHFDKNNEVRLRRLNPAYPERTVRRSEVKLMCRLVGFYQDMGPDET